MNKKYLFGMMFAVLFAGASVICLQSMEQDTDLDTDVEEQEAMVRDARRRGLRMNIARRQGDLQDQRRQMRDVQEQINTLPEGDDNRPFLEMILTEHRNQINELQRVIDAFNDQLDNL